MRFKILLVPIILSLCGYLFTTKTWIMFINGLTPEVGLAVYYCVVFMMFIVLKEIGLNIGGIEFNSWRHVVGSILIFFSFFILFDFSSCYQNEISYGNCDVPKNFLQTEDGVVYNFWNRYTKNIEKLRILTYVVTPFILTLVGILLINKKVELSIA